MHTMMDNRDLALTAGESLEYLASVIEEQALEDIFAYFEDLNLTIQFKGEALISAHGDPDTGNLTVTTQSGPEIFQWDDVEEEWFSEQDAVRLPVRIEQLIHRFSGAVVRLRYHE